MGLGVYDCKDWLKIFLYAWSGPTKEATSGPSASTGWPEVTRTCARRTPTRQPDQLQRHRPEERRQVDPARPWQARGRRPFRWSSWSPRSGSRCRCRLKIFPGVNFKITIFEKLLQTNRLFSYFNKCYYLKKQSSFLWAAFINFSWQNFPRPRQMAAGMRKPWPYGPKPTQVSKCQSID